MAGVARFRWAQPRLEVLPQDEGHLRRKQQFSWQEVLTLLAKHEMAIRRLHAELHEGALGSIRVVLIVKNGEIKMISAEADPALESIRDDVAQMVLRAGYPTNLVPMRMEIAAYFEAPGSQDAWSSDGWSSDTWSEGSGEGGGGRGGSSFGDPF